MNIKHKQIWNVRKGEKHSTEGNKVIPNKIKDILDPTSISQIINCEHTFWALINQFHTKKDYLFLRKSLDSYGAMNAFSTDLRRFMTAERLA